MIAPKYNNNQCAVYDFINDIFSSLNILYKVIHVKPEVMFLTINLSNDSIILVAMCYIMSTLRDQLNGRPTRCSQ